MTMYVLTVTNIEEEESYFMLFTTQEKAIDFINNNFKHDEPRKITNDYFEGKVNNYNIEDYAVDQIRL